jgi:hypothetical protein
MPFEKYVVFWQTRRKYLNFSENYLASLENEVVKKLNSIQFKPHISRNFRKCKKILSEAWRSFLSSSYLWLFLWRLYIWGMKPNTILHYHNGIFLIPFFIYLFL